MYKKMTDVALGLLGRSEARGWYPFGFHTPEHTLHRRIAPAISSATHALAHVITQETLAE